MNHSELFDIRPFGDGRWIVRHELTGELAGTIKQTAHGFRLKNEHAQDLGGFDSIESAVENLCEFA